MAKHYQHSPLMAILKRTEEQIQDNYASSQYAEVWDTLLYNALEPIVHTSKTADLILGDVLHFYVENHRRKLSSLPKELVMTSLVRFFISPSDNKLERLRKCRLERNILRLIANTFLTETAEYQQLTLEKIKASKQKRKIIDSKLTLIEQRVGYNGRLDLYSAINTVRVWLKHADDFKNMLLEKYLRLIVTHAQTYYKSNNSNLKLDDTIQNLVVYTSKALDKYDVRKGTLATYIQRWLQHAKNVSVVQEDGIAFLLPAAKRSEIANFSVPLDNAEVLEVEYECGENVELDSLRRRVQLLAKLVDPTGLGRLSLGISEVLSREEIALMKMHAVSH